MSSEHAKQPAVTRSQRTEDAVLKAIRELKENFSDFTPKLDQIQFTVNDIRDELRQCNERISQAESRISTVEDEMSVLQKKVRSLELDKGSLENAITDLEARLRRSNLRLVGLPEGREGSDACSFLEKWIPETLGMARQITLERAHRVGARRDASAPPRVLIMKFLNDREKTAVMQASRNKEIIVGEHKVRFYPDLAAGVLKQRKQFDSVRQLLRKMDIRHGMLVPARLVLTHKNKTHTFVCPSEAESFVRSIQDDKDSGGRG
ncbi:hypothetical protein WMY93_009547 [Mugilogobius chulae]|uniref:L1 transposable element RRM domain-containing protein n=1 Tax=Mugilogobius chulae TaxID=88201 RepID=A0AAW0PFI0_9GOBI